jgi:hypothetical protein
VASAGFLPVSRPWSGSILARYWRTCSFRTAFFALSWSFILLAAAYDSYFGWQYRSVLDAWEMNPFILWLAGIGGLATVFAFKLFAMVLSTGLAVICHFRRHRLEIPLTLVIGSAYLALSVHYVMSHLQG